MGNAIDEVNQRTMCTASAVRHYSFHEELTASERASVDSVAAAVRGQPILDIGVGGGRTVKPLRALSDDYVGIDYSEEMIAACRRRFPDAKLLHADARRLDAVADGSISLAMFSCNGIGMVSHEDRLMILREVLRVLRPGGFFLFSTHNLNSSAPAAGFRFPEFDWSADPARLVVRALRFAAQIVARLRNRRRFQRHEQRTSHYSVINDECHDYGTLLYYITFAQQRIQLESTGFEPNAMAYDGRGCLIATDTTDSSMAFVARKPVRS